MLRLRSIGASRRSPLTGCSTSASTLLAMNRAVRTGEPVRVTSLTSTTPRRVLISTRRPALVAATSYVLVTSPASITISTLSPFMATSGPFEIIFELYPDKSPLEPPGPGLGTSTDRHILRKYQFADREQADRHDQGPQH